eukprot:408187-Pelagomonas_calceolata.AAC.3
MRAVYTCLYHNAEHADTTGQHEHEQFRWNSCLHPKNASVQTDLDASEAVHSCKSFDLWSQPSGLRLCSTRACDSTMLSRLQK